ncbi:TonB-dependent siderophore receptor [Shewanella olleyana]|uniref:TonB-dependent siderophore receptor n=1 Tax=Shewanella olleyana TaxID=135626 RepID=UPI00200FB793|nr:TonB-dependent siderophore receptor [Shewanella olleyana]MCL1066143.1 TonB-dependent siderophore receptor [Shewanella olleyana]
MRISPIAFAVVAGLVSASLAAEEAQNDTETSQDFVANIERIQVTGMNFNNYKVGSSSGAMRGDIDLMDTPQSVNVIPDFVTDEQLATNLSEVLVNDSSVTGGSEKWNRQVFNIRGFELDSGSGYLINGQQQFSHYVQPIETLQQVEVLKGPSSMLYGQSGPGGLINMVNKKPTYESLFDVAIDTDQEGSTRFQLDAGGALNEAESIRYRTVLVKQDTKYWREYQDGNGDENQERDRFLGYLNLEFDLHEDVMLSVKYDYTDDKTGIDRGGWLDDNGDLVGDREDIWDMSWAFTDNNIENIGADLTWYISDDWKLTTGYNHQSFTRQRLDSSPTMVAGMDPTDPTQGYQIKAFDRFDDWQYKTGYMDFTGIVNAFGMEHQLLVGANILDYYYGTKRDTGDAQMVVPGQDVPKPDLDYHTVENLSESSYKHYGFYVQDLMTINDEWQVLAGVRYDEQKKDGEGENSYAVSPKFGVIYSPSANGSIYANYSKSFNPQSVVSSDNDVNDGMDLDPEYGEQYEIGTKWELYDGGLLLTGAVFDTTVSNVTVREQLEQPIGDNEYITTQSGKQHHRGFEMGAQGQVSERVFMTSSMMYLDAQYKTSAEDTEQLDGKTPVDAPEWSANIWTRYEVNDDFALNFGAIYVGERFANTQNTIVKDDYVRFDLGAAYTFAVKNTDMSVRFNIKNLFDTDYLAGGTNTDVMVGDGRHFSLAFESKF